MFRIRMVPVLVALGLLLSSAFGQVLTHGTFRDGDDASVWRTVERQLGAARGSFDWKDATLESIAKELANRLGRSVLFTKEAEARRKDTVTLELHDVSYATAIRVLAATAKVTFLYDTGLVFLTTPEDAVRRTLVTRFYDIADLLYQAPDFPGPDIHLSPSGVHGTKAETSDETRSSRDPNEIIDLIKMSTGADVWNADGVTITASKHLLVVRASPAVQRQVGAFIIALRSFL